MPAPEPQPGYSSKLQPERRVDEAQPGCSWYGQPGARRGLFDQGADSEEDFALFDQFDDVDIAGDLQLPEDVFSGLMNSLNGKYEIIKCFAKGSHT